MKLHVRFLIGLLVAVLFTVTLLAQTNSTPQLPGATNANPQGELAKLLLAVIVPAVVAGIKRLAPNIPGASLPILAIVLGALADYVGSLVGAWHGSFIIGAVLGAAGVGVREAADQLKQVVLPKPDDPPAQK